MTRIHYKKLRSRDIARKGQECMRKLRVMTLEDSSTDDDFKSGACPALQYIGHCQNVSVEHFAETSALPNKELCSVKRKTPKIGKSLVKKKMPFLS